MQLTDFFIDLGRPVAYYPKLTGITGGVKETLLLCQLLYWEGKQKCRERWIYRSQKELTEETGLSRYEQESARKNLIKKGFLEEKLAGVPATMHFRINLAAVNEAWIAFIKEATDLFEEYPQTSLRENPKLDCGKPANKCAVNPRTINTENTQENTQEIKPSVGQDAPRPQYQKIVDLYHDLCTPPLPKIRDFTDSRRSAVRNRWNRNPDIEVFAKLFKRVAASDFLMGRTERPWAGCGFDWIMRQQNFNKILEGNYDNKKKIDLSNEPLAPYHIRG